MVQTRSKSRERNGKAEARAQVLEQGIIYFFIRPRIGFEHPKDVGDVARSFIVLRPIGKDVKLGKGPLPDAAQSRLLALPKKVLPLGPRDRFVAFVEKSGTSFSSIKEGLLPGSDYETKTRGTRHVPEATQTGQGVYAITRTDHDSHLSYVLTSPDKPGEVQEELGIREQSSFIISTRNPAYEGPSFAPHRPNPGYSKEILEEFRSSSRDESRPLRWIPCQPAHLDYINTQVLLIGQRPHVHEAGDGHPDDWAQVKKDDPDDILENVDHQELNRMKHLPHEEAECIFTELAASSKDLEANGKDAPETQTSF